MQLDERKPRLNNYLKYTIVFSILTIVFALIVYYSDARPSAKTLYGLLADGFSLSGMMGLLGGLFLIVTNEGTFDLISYGAKRVFRATFDRNYRESMPQTFLEYREIMKEKRKKPALALFIVAGGFFMVGMLFVILFEYLPSIPI